MQLLLFKNFNLTLNKLFRSLFFLLKRYVSLLLGKLSFLHNFLGLRLDFLDLLLQLLILLPHQINTVLHELHLRLGFTSRSRQLPRQLLIILHDFVDLLWSDLEQRTLVY